MGIILVVILSGTMIVFFEIFPAVIFNLHGVDEIPDGGLTSLRMYALCIGVLGVNALFRLYFSTRGLQHFSTVLTLAGNSTMPVFAYIYSILFPAPYIWLSYFSAAVIILIVNVVRSIILMKIDKENEKADQKRIYLSVDSSDAINASKMVQNFAITNGYSLMMANRARLCMEEMVAYSVNSSKRNNVRNQIMFSFSDEEVLFTMLDDGACIVFDEDKEKQTMITNNYALLKAIAKSMQYQYVLGLNHTVLKFREESA